MIIGLLLYIAPCEEAPVCAHVCAAFSSHAMQVRLSARARGTPATTTDDHCGDCCVGPLQLLALRVFAFGRAKAGLPVTTELCSASVEASAACR